MSTDLSQCKAITKSSQKQCKKNVSIKGEEYCPTHGGKSKNANASAAKANKGKILCNQPNIDGKTKCKRTVKKEGDKCAQHSGPIQSAPKALNITSITSSDNQSAESTIFATMNVAFIRSFTDLLDTYSSRLMRDLTEWYLIGINRAKDHELSDHEWASWIAGGCSNPAKNSFKELHGYDAMIFLAHLPPMSTFKTFLLEKYEKLANAEGKYPTVQTNWNLFINSAK